MAEIIPSGVLQADSDPFTLAAGEEANLMLRIDSTGPQLSPTIVTLVRQKGYDDAYYTIDQLDGHKTTGRLQGVGTYRLRRLASAVAYAVDKN